ncbi:MAG TPA: TauD/TfdA family dioxygenase, partial [Burkholderiales bacterium]|nr:TauD/TfdA family dioxygenase [Burkholderiales bacterium]
MASELQVRDKSAWMGRDFREDNSWIVSLTKSQIGELSDAARTCIARGLAVTDVKRSDFELEAMAAVVEGWADEINSGRGFLLVKGLPAAAIGDAMVRTIFWGIGLYMGSPVSQNSYGEMLGEVYDEGVKMGTGRVRGYRTNQRLMFHTDRADMVGLLCQRTARSGGLSSLVSSTRIYNEIAHNHPEYLAPLEHGYIHANMEEGGAFTTYRMPVYSVTDGTV